jgi:hypothetical protein
MEIVLYYYPMYCSSCVKNVGEKKLIRIYHEKRHICFKCFSSDIRSMKSQNPLPSLSKRSSISNEIWKSLFLVERGSAQGKLIMQAISTVDVNLERISLYLYGSTEGFASFRVQVTQERKRKARVLAEAPGIRRQEIMSFFEEGNQSFLPEAEVFDDFFGDYISEGKGDGDTLFYEFITQDSQSGKEILS